VNSWLSPFVLEAMTLRGLGSYLHGARLEIRPLTILCGTNGSGKSTWFRMLRILRMSLERGTLPFSLEGDLGCGEGDSHDYTNPLVRNLFGYTNRLTSAAEDRDFGLLGTVGLHIKSDATGQLTLASRSSQPLDQQDAPPEGLFSGSLPHSFLSNGDCPRGTRFRVRITDPTDLAAIHDDASPLDRMVELVINDMYSIRFTRRSPSPIRHYTATCTRAFWPGRYPEDLTELVVGQFDLDEAGSPINVRSPSGEAPFNLQEWFCRAAIARIRELLAATLWQVHWIGAIRSVERSSHVEEGIFEDSRIIRARYVGGEGEYAHALARKFACNEMRLAGSEEQGSIDYSFRSVPAGVHSKLIAVRDSANPSPVHRIWELASEESKTAVSGIEPSEDEEAPTCVIKLLNEVIQRRDLYDSAVWTSSQPDVSAQVRGEIHYLSDNELAKFNRKLVESAFPDMLLPHRGLVFETFYAAWLHHLLDTHLIDLGSVTNSADDDWTGEQPPCGFLLKYTPDEERALAYEVSDYRSPDELKQERRTLDRFKSPPFQGNPFSAAPIHMSSGFHQIAPIIVQAGLMKGNEVMCVENPEVHLHPKLQLEVAEFLLRQASIGKYVVVETHSDLVVRRVMRAVLAEELSQEAVRLYFARVASESNNNRQWAYPVVFSVLEPLEIDESGRVRNWPDGFLDADIRESRRLLDAMYGNPTDDSNRDDNEEIEY
jgi:predicted ATPase